MKILVSYIAQKHAVLDRDLTVNDLVATIQSKHRNPDGMAAELLEIAKELHSLEDLQLDEVQPYISDYLTRELVAKAAEYIMSKGEGDALDLSVPTELLQLASELAHGLDLGIEDLSEAPLPSADTDRAGVATIGLGPRMDAHLGGGQGLGEMLIWLAPPGVGKTSFLISQGIEMARDGEHVLHISLEISGAKCRQRSDQKLTGLSREQRLVNPGLVAKARAKLKGKFYIKDWCAKNVTIDDIRALVKSMRAQGQEVTAVCVDYLELMAPTKNNRHGERFNFSSVAKELRRLGNELGVKIVTAWQVNRLGAEKHVIGKVDVSECWDVVKHADIIMGLNQNPEELANHRLRVNIIKQRESTARPIEYYYCNLDRMVIREQNEGELDGPVEEMGGGNRPRIREHGSCTAPT
jgi:KaiC/GvpD/RAD55 family RecA-like ATPase